MAGSLSGASTVRPAHVFAQAQVVTNVCTPHRYRRHLCWSVWRPSVLC